MRGTRAAVVHFLVFTVTCVAVTGLVLLGMARAGVFEQGRLKYFDTSSLIRPAPKNPNRAVIVLNNPPDESDCAEIITDYGHGRRPVLKQYEKIMLPPPRVMSADEIRARKRIEQNSIQERVSLRFAEAKVKQIAQETQEREERHRHAMEREIQLQKLHAN